MLEVKNFLDQKIIKLIKKIFEFKKKVDLDSIDSTVMIDKLRFLCKSIDNSIDDIDELIINCNKKNKRYQKKIQMEEKTNKIIKACLPFMTLMNIMI